MIVVLGGIWAAVALTTPRDADQPLDLSYSALTAAIDEGRVRTLDLADDGAVSGEFLNGTRLRSRVPMAASLEDFLGRVERAEVDLRVVRADGDSLGWLVGLVFWVVPIGLIVLLWRSSSKAGSGLGASAFGRSKAKVIDEQRPGTTFADVAGYEGVKDEVWEVVDYLRHPERYHEAGAVGPGGVLMVGPPGTGKTHIARAIAGEADVPFFSVTGSSFVEMFVGVGASRVRDLFAQARTRAPAIVFIDEIDAIGGRRGVRQAVSNDEREQTLNQLLAEMDGFDPAVGVVVLAATNRPDVLDPALLRAGRFDRQVVVPLPNQSERGAILAVHCRSKQLGEDVVLTRVARSTPGFSGADLANLANEAAIVAVRDRRVVVSAADFDEARDRIILGRRDKGHVLLEDERHLVAVHEAGHAVVAALSAHADPVSKVSILPAGAALGVTHQLPIDERHLYTEGYLQDALAVRLGGRAAERLVLGERSSGAADDLASATALAGRMVRELGLSDVVGPVGYSSRHSAYLGESTSERDFSEATQQLMDGEVAALLRRAEKRASELLCSRRTELDRLIILLTEEEVLDGTQVYQVLGLGSPG
ncbi:MAG: ATP-dependent zinc metalloprotease FtsH [Acidimicrobiales bacterium]